MPRDRKGRTEGMADANEIKSLEIKSPEIKSLTGMRGIAALAVTLYHLYPFNRTSDPLIAHVQSKGYLCVDLFFVLSGYVMALNYGPMFTGRFRGARLGDFLLRRIARLYPIYIAVLGVRVAYTLLVVGNFHSRDAWLAVTTDHPARDLLANVLLVQSWHMAPSINGQAWSISTEWAAYFLFPVLVPLVLLGRRRSAVLAAIGASLLIVAAMTLDATDGAYHSGALDAYDGMGMSPLLRCLGGFSLGMVCYRASQQPVVSRIASTDLFGMAVLALLVAGLLLRAPDLVLYAAFPALVLCLSGNRGWLDQLFSSRPVFLLGVLSYSIYMLHPFLIVPLRTTETDLGQYLPVAAADLLAGTAIMAFLLGSSAITYAYVEKPGRVLLRAIRLPGAPARGEPARGEPSPCYVRVERR
jgi:peptidoglycan/LPS O-acetylase OafA/YrhL